MITILEARSQLPDNMAFMEFVADKDADTVKAFEKAHPGVDGLMWKNHVYYNGRPAQCDRLDFWMGEEKE